ncbi:DUF3786 domain-containing protein [Desulfatitalea tepidiphila]|uniref:DUF3786 domain-containing protein n=1 Tax=Desulfatitalea tepidiphila TaxID=1185843 RepID=UPI0006B61D19|nr:DUF3786 domain-containing protein [Desulfatitalea tepidiphila]
MAGAYATIIKDNLERLFSLDLDERAAAMGARRDGDALQFMAFGAACRLTPAGITLDGQPEDGPRGIIISLYGLHATGEDSVLEPLQSFKEAPNSAPYVGAFANRTEQSLVPLVPRLGDLQETIRARLDGGDAPAAVSGDIAFVVRPLPKIALCYVCYLPDDDFPAGVTCLYSHNAHLFLPTDALADVGEYTSQAILALAKQVG